jgi:hypothetical protein
LRRSNVNVDILPLEIAKFGESLAKWPQRLGAGNEKEADAPHPLALLRAHR